jgi:hypothetical protein
LLAAHFLLLDGQIDHLQPNPQDSVFYYFSRFTQFLELINGLGYGFRYREEARVKGSVTGLIGVLRDA